jgi:hypothetical protein
MTKPLIFQGITRAHNVQWEVQGPFATMASLSFPNDEMAVFCGNNLLHTDLSSEEKRKHLFQNLRSEGIAAQKVDYAPRKLILSLGAKRLCNDIACTVDDILSHRHARDKYGDNLPGECPFDEVPYK